MTVPRLLDPRRRSAAALLALLAMGQAAVAVTFASLIGSLAGQAVSLDMLVLPAILLLGAAAAVIAERLVAEHFAQSFVTDCRAALFDSVIRVRSAGGVGGEARWLAGLVGDLAALRNYAVRGSVRLVTAALAGTGAMLWLGLTYPDLRTALLPLLAGLTILIPIALWLSCAITAQRQQRGRLTRFLVRRVRIELGGEPTPNGHGRRKLRHLSDELATLAVRRAVLVGSMEGVALAAGMASLLILVLISATVAPGTVLTGFALIGFMSARLLEGARALHARIGGVIALDRVQRLVMQPVHGHPLAAKEVLDA